MTFGRLACVTSVVPLGLGLAFQGVLVRPAPPTVADPLPAEVPGIIAKMEAAYARVEHYRTDTEVMVYRRGELVATRRFLYTFKKPCHIRLDFESPHRGMILVYPDEHGRVVVKPGGWLGFLKLHLSTDSPRLRSQSGQRIDQTDMGLLIANIVHSLTDQRRGPVDLSHQDGRVRIEVLAQDHFLDDTLTRYRFTVDKATWLPAGVEELTPEGVPKRRVSFRDLNTSIDPPADSFRIGRTQGGRDGCHA